MPESNAEWLLKIKSEARSWSGLIENDENDYQVAVKLDSYNWLIEQAELVPVMEKELKFGSEQMATLVKNYNVQGTALSNRNHAVHFMTEENKRLKDDWAGSHEVLRKSVELLDVFEVQVKRLREALSEIKDEEEQNLEGYESTIYKIARQALEGVRDEKTHKT